MTPQVAPQVTPQVARVLEAASSACSFAEPQAAAGLKDRVHFLKTHLEPLLLAGWIERTIPDKPRSSKQKYRLTEKGRQALRERTGGGR
jgi:ATP-dependent DNA helicase RecG